MEIMVMVVGLLGQMLMLHMTRKYCDKLNEVTKNQLEFSVYVTMKQEEGVKAYMKTLRELLQLEKQTLLATLRGLQKQYYDMGDFERVKSLENLVLLLIKEDATNSDGEGK